MADTLVTIVFLAALSLSGLAITAANSAGHAGFAAPSLSQSR